MRKLLALTVFLASAFLTMQIASSQTVTPGTRTKAVTIPLASCINVTDFALLNTTSDPRVTVANNIPALAWLEGETDKAGCGLQVPGDYNGNPQFRLLVQAVQAASDTAIDFEVFVNIGTGGFYSGPANQNPVTVADNITTQTELVLTIVSDFANLAIFDWVNLNFWRTDTSTGSTATVRVFGATFEYTAID